MLNVSLHLIISSRCPALFPPNTTSIRAQYKSSCLSTHVLAVKKTRQTYIKLSNRTDSLGAKVRCLSCWLYKHKDIIAKEDTIKTVTPFALQASSRDNLVGNHSQYLQSKFGRQSHRLLQYSHFYDYFSSCMAEPKVNWTSASVCSSQRVEWAAFTLSCFHSFGLILNISESKTETRKFLCFLCVCNLQMLFLPSIPEDGEKTVHSDLCGCWQMFELHWGCFYK